MDPRFFLPCFHGLRAKNSVHNLPYGSSHSANKRYLFCQLFLAIKEKRNLESLDVSINGIFVVLDSVYMIVSCNGKLINMNGNSIAFCLVAPAIHSNYVFQFVYR